MEYNIKQLIKRAHSEIEEAPDGVLRISESHGKKQYYQICGKEKIYISKENIDTAKKLAQKDYAQKVLNKLESLQALLKNYAENYKNYSPADTYKELSVDRQKLVQPYEISDKEFAEKWQAEQYDGLPIKSGTVAYKTDRGEIVRSKSELLIANKLNSHGLKYKYECPLKLTEDLTYYPDFTILHPKTREEWILEHFGMLNNADYLESSVVKLLNYSQNGYILGNRFLMTFETTMHPFQPIYLDHLLETFFM